MRPTLRLELLTGPIVIMVLLTLAVFFPSSEERRASAASPQGSTEHYMYRGPYNLDYPLA